jgi:hypothetical protein
MMKMRVVVIVLLVLISGSLTAQSYDTIRSSFDTFATDIAKILPFLGGIGLNWSDAYIGNFPHFGAGATLGFMTVPYDSVNTVAQNLGIDLSALPGIVQTLGVPLPIWCVEGRIGGIGIPFDAGAKFGYLPDQAKFLLPSNISFDYLLLGGDVRFALLQENAVLPDLSIGAGVNYMSGNISVLCITPGAIYDLAPYTTAYDLILDPGNLNFFWRSLSIDLKAQVSKKLAFMTFSAGTAVSYGLYAEAGGGFSANIRKSSGSLTQSDIDFLKANLPGIESLSASGIDVKASANGFGWRVFGGLSFDILLVKLDISAIYSILSNSLGASFNARVQL